LIAVDVFNVDVCMMCICSYVFRCTHLYALMFGCSGLMFGVWCLVLGRMCFSFSVLMCSAAFVHLLICSADAFRCSHLSFSSYACICFGVLMCSGVRAYTLDTMCILHSCFGLSVYVRICLFWCVGRLMCSVNVFVCFHLLQFLFQVLF